MATDKQRETRTTKGKRLPPKAGTTANSSASRKLATAKRVESKPRAPAKRVTSSSTPSVLANVPAAMWSPHASKPAPRALARLAERYSFELPADYRELHAVYNGGSITGPRSLLHIEAVDDLEVLNYDMVDDRRDLPSMFVIGDDGGGSVYFYDPLCVLACGPRALFMISMSTTRGKNAIFVGRTLTDVVERIVSGTNLHKLPARGKPFPWER